MKIKKTNIPFPALSIDDFIPSSALVRAAAESFENMPDKDWVKYNNSTGQVQYCSKVPRLSTPSSLAVLDYISTYFNPSEYFKDQEVRCFPDLSHYGGGMMLTPNKNGEGGHLGLHVDASVHGIHKGWKREYSAVLCVSEEYDETFDLIIHDGKETATRLPYKFNRLNVFKCSEDSWHGVKPITAGMSRKTLGVMYWSKIPAQEIGIPRTKAKFNHDIKL
jgi:hypothetical protein